MRRIVLTVLLLALAPVAAPAQGVGPNQDRRAELEQQVRRQFMARSGGSWRRAPTPGATWRWRATRYASI